MSNYPEHAKMIAVKEQAEAAGDFLEWLLQQGFCVAQWSSHEGLMPIRRPTEQWLADWLEIDLTKIDEEKQLMLEELRNDKT